jgi:hypothetical protein
MANLWSQITKLFNRIIDIASQGNLERIKIIKTFNFIFNEAYLNGEIDRNCSVTSGIGNPTFRHVCSTTYLRSGFKITIHNDNKLTSSEINEISKYILDSNAFVRQLMTLGYDTLIIVGNNTYKSEEYSLNNIADLHKYMIQNRTNEEKE